MSQSSKFKYKAHNLISKLEKLIEEMPENGNSIEDSQKICLKVALNNFYYTVNGVTESDFKSLPDEG